MSHSFTELGEIGQITASLVVDATGRHVSSKGTSRGLGNDSDLELLIWLRRRATVILTSGLTARLEQYKLPRNALLAILSREGVPHLAEAPSDRVLRLPLEIDSYQSALSHLIELGHKSIHTEFGPLGFIDLVASGRATGLISSIEPGASLLAAKQFGLGVQRHVALRDLEVAVLAGRGSIELTEI